eukprot:3068556-Prymnesium_polylepis.1
MRAKAHERGRELLRGGRAKHVNSTHVEPRLKMFAYGGQLRAASGKTGSASRCMMYTQFDREKTELSRCMNRRALLLSKGGGWRGCKWYRTLHACPMHVRSVAGSAEHGLTPDSGWGG